MTDQEYYPILDRIIRYCSYAERCFQDVDKRLYPLQLSPDIKDKITDDLIEQNIVNEERFAFTYTIGKLRYNKWGRIKIRSHLKAKRISDSHIQKAFSQLDLEEYHEILNHILKHKYERLSDDDDQFNKTVRYGQSKGFELSLIFDVVNKLVGNEI
jgi:regulatory protein